MHCIENGVIASDLYFIYCEQGNVHTFTCAQTHLQYFFVPLVSVDYRRFMLLLHPQHVDFVSH